MGLVFKCKNTLSDVKFKQFFTDTQKNLNSYQIALDMNILIDGVGRYYQNMKPEDLDTIYQLHYKYLKSKSQPI